jgi:SAM-dependent methyltransferase
VPRPGVDEALRHPGALAASTARTGLPVRPRTQKLIWRAVYGVSNLGSTPPAFMNYGFAPLDGDVRNGSSGHPGEDRFGMALYDRVAGAANLENLDVLDLGCGRGGGTSWAFSAHRPRSMIGMDLSGKAVGQASLRFGRPGLEFRRGDAENLPFPEECFDAVLNVESCHCYPDVPRFLREGHRVLRPGGILLMADVRHTDIDQVTVDGPFSHDDVRQLKRHIAQSPFEVVEEEDITENVRLALELDGPRRREVIERRVPRFLQTRALRLAAVEGTPMHEAFVSGGVTYLRFKLRKAGRG